MFDMALTCEIKCHIYDITNACRHHISQTLTDKILLQLFSITTDHSPQEPFDGISKPSSKSKNLLQLAAVELSYFLGSA